MGNLIIRKLFNGISKLDATILETRRIMRKSHLLSLVLIWPLNHGHSLQSNNNIYGSHSIFALISQMQTKQIDILWPVCCARLFFFKKIHVEMGIFRLRDSSSASDSMSMQNNYWKFIAIKSIPDDTNNEHECSIPSTVLIIANVMHTVHTEWHQ